MSAADPEFSIETIGLADAEHTAADGTRVNNVYQVNDQYALGGAHIGGDRSTGGASVWIYDGQTTTRMGFYDGIHVWSGGFSLSGTTDFLSNGYVAGYSYQNGVAGGKTAWFYDGNSTVRVGIYDLAHTRNDLITNNFANSVNTSGQVVGWASRYDIIQTRMTGVVQAYCGETGITAWFFDGTTTHTSRIYRWAVHRYGRFEESSSA